MHYQNCADILITNKLESHDTTITGHQKNRALSLRQCNECAHLVKLILDFVVS